GALGHLGEELPGLQVLLDVAFINDGRLDVACGNLLRDATGYRADRPFELAYTGFTRVPVDDELQCIVGDLELLLRKAVALGLPRDEVPPGYLELFILRIAGDLDHLHTVAEGSRDHLVEVRRGDEEHLRQVVV